LRVGFRARAPKFAAMLLAVRRRSVRQARTLLKQVEQAMAADLEARSESIPYVHSAAC